MGGGESYLCGGASCMKLSWQEMFTDSVIFFYDSIQRTMEEENIIEVSEGYFCWECARSRYYSFLFCIFQLIVLTLAIKYFLGRYNRLFACDPLSRTEMMIVLSYHGLILSIFINQHVSKYILYHQLISHHYKYFTKLNSIDQYFKTQYFNN